MKQLILGKVAVSNAVLNVLPAYAPLMGASWSHALLEPDWAFRYSHPWSVAGTFKTLYVEQLFIDDVNSGGGWSDIPITLYINDTPTALGVLVPAHAAGTPGTGFTSSAVDLTHSVHINPGDRVAMSLGACSMTFGPNFQGLCTQWSLVFESDNPGESGYGQSSYGGGAGSATNRQYAQAFGNLGGFGVANDTISDCNSHSIVPLEGSVTRIDVACEVAPGVGKQRRFILSLNNVFQDGTGGTVNTMATISGTNTTAFFEFDCPVHVLDRLGVMEMVEAVQPDASLIQGSLRFRATTDGEFVIAGGTAGATPANAAGTDWTDYAAGWAYGWAWSTANAPTPGVGPNRWPMSESNMSYPGPGAGSFSITKLAINVNANIPTGNYRYMTRRALADTAAFVDVAGSAIVFVGSGLAGPFASPSDRLDIQAFATGGPAATQVTWTWLVVNASAQLTLTKSHVDPFYQGQHGATYTIVASNTGAADTVGVQTVTETVPAGLTLISMEGYGWVCVGNVCTRSDALAPGDSYQPITVVVDVAAGATSPQINLAKPNTDANVPDSTTIVSAPTRTGYRYIAKVAHENRTMRVPRKP